RYRHLLDNHSFPTRRSSDLGSGREPAPPRNPFHEESHHAGGIHHFDQGRRQQDDHRGELNTLLLHAPDGRLRLRHLLPALAPHYDLLLIDTQGARSVLLEMAVLASSLALSPVTPEILGARELRRGPLQRIEDIAPYRHLGIEPPPLRLLINRVHPVSSNARLIQQALQQVFQAHA